MKCTECGQEGHPWWDHREEWGDDFQFGEEPLEPYIDWNLTDAPEGIEIRTRGERRKIMAENKFEYRPKPKLGTLYFDMKGSSR